MFYLKEAEILRKKIKEKGYTGFHHRFGDVTDGINYNLFLLVNDLSLDEEDFCRECELISIDSDEALRIITFWMNSVDINPNPFDLLDINRNN